MGDEHLHSQESGANNQSTDHVEERKKIRLRVKQIRERPDRMSPIVAYFSTSYDPLEVDPETGERVHETPEVTVYTHRDEPKEKFQVVVRPPGANVYFKGTSYSGETAVETNTAYALGVVNREAKTIRIFPVAANKCIRLEPYVIGQETEEEAEASGSGPQDTSTSSIVARNIPPYDASATTPPKAYPLDKIIDEDEREALQDIYLLLQQESVAAAIISAYPVFVRNRLHKLRNIEVDSEKKMLSAALSLLTYLVKFKDMNSTVGLDSANGHEFPGIIRQKCFSLFKDPFPRTNEITVDKTNLLISYVLVLSLHVDNFKTDPEDIAQDLRMSAIDLRKHLVSLGCKLSWEKSTLVATLPTPLKFSDSKLKTKRRIKKIRKE
ncbi:PREDICTED: DNA-directed RNA polymerase I subunit rpa49 [Camelina sativa]|uniref:DNA-directed RNA polymerase I subunit rpa49 n=1 Tax=Camelina sativa TaxID=90675 RepID=A0ABM0XPK6_CAMSA|nr:PREDICTED: DNA-directed RNA polymerase I subunit rpa49 [Camelina sativa]XP_010488985.1 PREDICTED: DNA-directed RNA polymerase I subunit rpa49 [Camelina sativa]